MKRFASVALATLLLIGGIAGFATASVAATGVDDTSVTTVGEEHNDEYENNDDLNLDLDIGEENNEQFDQNEDDELLGLL